MKKMILAVGPGSGHDNDSLSQSHPQEGDNFSDLKPHQERTNGLDNQDLVYDDAEHEPQFHFRTWFALAAMWLFNYVAILALLSPPVVVSSTPMIAMAILI